MNSSTTPVALDGGNGIGSTHFDAQTTNCDEFNGQETSPTKVPGEIQPTMILQAPAPMVILSSTTPSGSNTGNAATPSSTLASNSPSSASPTPSTPDVDPQIIEALKSKDRIYVLKLGEQMESLIKEKRSRVDLTPASSYQRLLVHRCSAYYRLSPDTDPVTKTIFVQRTPDSRIPERRICELVPPESSSQPTFKIMRRSQGDRRNKPHSQAGSVAGEDGDLSDVEPSEAGSLGGRSTGGSKKHMTIQEREAAYNEARSRIFMGFEEKEKAKEKDMSASSSSLSLNSASASSANGDSLGDLDGSVCSPATESEWSGPPGQYARDRKDHNRRGNSSASSSRSMRSGYHGNHSNPSSRNSRASSPSFKYASLYEPPSQQLYDPNQPPNQMNAPYGTQYYHPFVPQGYMPPYNTGAYHPYPGYPPPHDPHHPPPPPPEPPRPTEHYPQPHMGYPYMWHPPNQPPPIQTTSLGQPGPMQPHQAHQGPAHPVSSPAQSPVQYPYGQPPAQYPYGAPGGYGHPAQGYYAPPPPQSQPMMPPPPPHPSMQMPIPGHVYDSPQSTGPPHGGQPLLNHSSSAPPPHGYAFNLNARSTIGNGPPPPSQAIPNGRHNVRNTVPQPNNGHGNKGRNNPTMARNPWSYGPGISAGGYVGPPAGSSDTVGPRLTSARRQSNLSGGSSRASSYNDDGLSTTSSSTTTSSSSRRTYTSTASSQHPLPPRPDWAVGLKAQPTLARGSHEHSTSPRNPMSPSRGMNGNGHLPPVLQPTDFPPLSSGPSPEKRNPVPSGAWGNNANRAILGPPAGGTSGDGERSLSNPSPKGDSHKLLRRPTGSDGSPGQDRSPGRQADLQANGDILATRMQVLTIEETIAAVESRAAQSEALAAAAAAQGHQANVV